MERGRGQERGRGRGGRGQERGRGRGGGGRGRGNWGRGDNGDRGRGGYRGDHGNRGFGHGFHRGRGGFRGGSHLEVEQLIWEEAIQSIKENKIDNLKKLIKTVPQLIHPRGEKSLLITAIAEGNREAMDLLIEHPDLNLEQHYKGRTVLDFAARHNASEQVFVLMGKNVPGKPFLAAVEGGHLELAKQLMRALYSSPEEAALDHRGDRTLAVHFAGSVECLTLVLPYSDVNALSVIYGTPLQAAIELGHYEVAEHLIDHVPDVEFEPDSCSFTQQRYSPLFLAYRKNQRNLAEKLLNTGHCQKTLDAFDSQVTADEFLRMIDDRDGHVTGDKIQQTNIQIPKRPQQITWVPPKTPKETWLKHIFTLLNVPEPERNISYDPSTATAMPKLVDSINNYASIDQCPTSLLREYLKNAKFDVDVNALHLDLVEKVVNLQRAVKTTIPDDQKAESDVEIIFDGAEDAGKLVPNCLPFKEYTGWCTREDQKYDMKLTMDLHRGSVDFFDLKVPGSFQIYRSHFFNQNAMINSSFGILMGAPQLYNNTHLTEGVSYRRCIGQVKNSFGAKIVVEQVEPGVELFSGEISAWLPTNAWETEEESFGGKIFFNNGRTYLFFASKIYSGHLEDIQQRLDPLDDGPDSVLDDDFRRYWAVPTIPYQFFVGEVKNSEDVDEITRGASSIIEGIWFESKLEKFNEADLLKEENFGLRGTFRVVSVAPEEKKE